MVLDIHSHIVPFVDDGSRSIEESIRMIQESIDNGVTHLIATPHQIPGKYESSSLEILRNFNILKFETERLHLPIKLFLGEEIHYTCRNISSRLSAGELLSLNGSKYILLEFSYSIKPDNFYDILYDLNCDGYTVIVAHFERYSWATLNIALEIHQSKNLIQVNAGNLMGKNGFKTKKFVKKLLKLNLVDYVGSDIHFFRPSLMKSALKKAKNTRINPDLFKCENSYE